MAAKPIPFEFVIEQLGLQKPSVKAMFGAHGVYIGEKIALILRNKDKSPKDNGVWIATTPEHHKSLKKDFPKMRSIKLFGPGPTGWQILPSDDPYFEEAASKACEFILNGDPRIGKTPKGRKLKAKIKKRLINK